MPARHHRLRRHHHRSRLARVVLASTGVALGVALAACGDGSPTTPAPHLDRQAGVLQLDGASLAAATDVTTSGPIRWSQPPGAGTVTPPQVIELPDTVRVGQSVDVIVRTVLPDGCWSTDGQDVRQSALLVEVTPQDVRSDAQACTMIYGFGAHRFTVTFGTAGTATGRVTGRRLRHGGTTTSDPVTAERSVVVR